MAKAVSAEELELRKRARRRLVGAIAIVLLAVIFLPMVLDSEPRPVTQDVVIQIPSQNQGQFVSKIVPVTPETKAAPAAGSEPKPADKDLAKSEATILSPPAKAPVPPPDAAPKVAEATQAVKAAAEPPAPKTAPAESAKPQAAPPAKASPPAPAKGEAKAPAKPDPKAAAGGFVVQVAALSDTGKAQAMKDQIAGAGFPAYTESVPTASGPVMRVRAGPFASRAAAEAARDKLKGLGMAGNVTTK
jgi:DedD protein